MRYLLLLVLGMAHFGGLAQDQILLFDTFTEREEGWPWGSSEHFSAVWDSGFVHLRHLGAEEDCFLKEIFLKDAIHLSIETSLRLDPSSLLNHYGLCWSADPSGKRYQAFQIRPEGDFRLVSVNGSEETILSDWKRSRRIRPAGEYNSLKIEKKGRSLYGFINHKEVFRIPWQRFNGKYQGLCFQGNGQWQIDYFRVDHPEIPIPLVDPPMLFAASFPLDSMLADSSRNESAPRLSPDGKTIYFTLSPLEDGLRSGEVWFTHFQGDTLWTTPAPLFAETDNTTRQEVFYIGPDHQSMWLSSTGKSPSEVYGISFRDREGLWQPPIQAEIPSLNHRGAPANYHLSADQEILLLSLDRPDSYGERDLYACFREGRGWTAPLHLGADINTWGEEISPYLMSDNKTLFFSSSGRPGYGQLDVYMSIRQSNTWTDWSEPLNLGPGINGAFWDINYLPLKNPRRAYMSRQDSSGNFDLYTVRIPEDYTAKGVARVFGKLHNQKNGALLSGQAHFEALTGDSLQVDFATISPAQGYQGLLAFGQAYAVHANVPGYFPIVDTLDLRRIDHFQEMKQDLWLRPLEIGQVIQLRQVYFKRAKAELRESSYPELDRLVLLMTALPGLEIEIQGHTDNLGKADELQTLSEARASTVLDYLVSHGIDSQRIKSRGFGASRPVASNENPATRPLNRRVEFEILAR